MENSQCGKILWRKFAPYPKMYAYFPITNTVREQSVNLIA